jgi:hypothetical protein
VSIVDVLYQDEFWIGQDGRRYEVATMHQEHRLNLLAYLERNAERLAEHRDWQIRHRGTFTKTNRRRGLPVFPSPLRWIMGTPFVQELMRAIVREDALDAEVVTNAPEVAARLLLERHGSSDDGR